MQNMSDEFIPDRTVVAPGFQDRGRLILSALIDAVSGAGASNFGFTAGIVRINGGELTACVEVEIGSICQPFTTTELRDLSNFLTAYISEPGGEYLSEIGSTFIVIARGAADKADELYTEELSINAKKH